MIEELKAISRKAEVSGVSLRGRRSMCLHPLVSKHAANPREALEACNQLKRERKCPYYENMLTKAEERDELAEQFSTKPTFASEIVAACRRHDLCPYDSAKLLLDRVNVVALSYLFLFDPAIRAGLFKYLRRSLGDVIFVLDEAHNLPEIATEIASDSLTAFSIDRARREALEHDYDDIAHFCRLLEATLREFSSEIEIEALIDPFLFLESVSEKFPMGEYTVFFAYMVDSGTQIKKALLERKSFPRSYVGRAGEFLLRWIETAGVESYSHIISRYVTRARRESSRLEIVALDPRAITQPVLSAVRASVSMSGTLEPIGSYARVVGLEEDRVHSEAFPSPFPREHILALACRGVTTSLDRRCPEMYGKLAKREGT